jgi:hypothetical protein
MDKLRKKDLRLLCEIITDDYRKVAPRKPLADYIQLRIYQLTGLHVAKSKIIKIKSFKKITKKVLIVDKGRTIKVIRKRNKKNRH